MLTLGEELLLVALDADKGVIRGSAAMQIGLNAAGMADLAALGRLTLRQADGRPGVTVVEDTAPEVEEHPLLVKVLDEARDTREGDRHPERCLKNWVWPSLHSYLGSLRSSGILKWDRGKPPALYGRFHVLDEDTAAAARARIERVATGAEPSVRDLDLAGIVHGLGLDKHLYKGLRNRSRREALAKAVAKQRYALMLAHVLPEIPGQKFTFDSKNDLKMAMDMYTAIDTPGNFT